MRHDTLNTVRLPKLVLCDVSAVQRRGHIGSRVPIAGRPIGHEMRYCRQAISTTPTTIIRDSCVGVTMEFQHRNVATARGTDRLDNVVCIDCGGIRTGGICRIRVESAGMRSKCSEYLRHCRVACENTTETSTVRHASGKDTSRVNAICGSEIGNQGCNEALIVDIWCHTHRGRVTLPLILSAVSYEMKLSVGKGTYRDTLRIDGDRKRIPGFRREARVPLNGRGRLGPTVESKDQRCSIASVVGRRDVDVIRPVERLEWVGDRDSTSACFDITW